MRQVLPWRASAKLHLRPRLALLLMMATIIGGLVHQAVAALLALFDLLAPSPTETRRTAATREFHVYFSVSCQTPFQSAGSALRCKSSRRRRNTVAGPSVGTTVRHLAKHCSDRLQSRAR